MFNGLKRGATMKTRLESLLIGLALVTGVFQTTAQITNLGIAPAAGGQSLLYWQASAITNYILQSTTNLAAPGWNTEKYPVPVAACLVSNFTPAKFFRLVYTNPPAGMALIPAGTFLMGNSVGDGGMNDARPTNIYVSAFFMDTNVVTWNVWQAVYILATTFSGYGFDNPGAGNGANYPVESVNWYDCVKWCNARSQEAGLTPCYYTDAGFTQLYKTGDVDAVFVDWSANGYRLPTEAEWEKAARGGLNGFRFPWGNLISEAQANYTGHTNDYSYDRGPDGYNPLAGGSRNTGAMTTPVGSFDVNGYGLYDTAGNVGAWCWDWYGTQYGRPGNMNPTGPASGSLRVLRGGDWADSAIFTRCAYRYNSPPGHASNNFGIRCVRGF
jgi:sulfatase modifying factor 1